MKKSIIAFSLILTLESCATILGGAKTDHQRHRAECGEPRRRIRVGFLIADCIFFPPGILIDFATKKIYKRFPNENKIRHCNTSKLATPESN